MSRHKESVPSQGLRGGMAWLACVLLLGACSSPGMTTEPATSPAGAAAPVASSTPARAVAAKPPDAPARNPAPAAPTTFIAPAPIPFEASIARAGQDLLAQGQAQLGKEARTLVIDPLIDANTGAQTVSTVKMGAQLQRLVDTQYKNWTVKPLTRQALATQPLLLIGTLTPVNVERAIDTPPDAFRVWLTLIDLRTGRVIAKQIDRSTIDSVNPEPLKFYQDSPTWTKDSTVLGYINSCQINTKIGDPADPEYLARLPAAAVVNEAIIAYDAGKIPEAQKLYREAEPLAGPGDLRVLNGLYLTSWQLGQRDAAKDAFGKLVGSGLELKRLPLKILFQPGKTAFNDAGDLPQQYKIWIDAVGQEAGKVSSCMRVVGHASRTGSAIANERLSRQRAEAVQKMLQQNNRNLAARLSVAGVGSREALVGIGTDDQRDALDRRVEFRVVDCV